MPRKKTSKKSAPAKAAKKTGPNKSDFVRSMPNATAGEIVKAAREKSITIQPGLVYAVRSAAKGPKKAKGKPGRPKGSSNKTAATKSSGANRAVIKFAFLVREIGPELAREVLAEVEQEMKAGGGL